MPKTRTPRPPGDARIVAQRLRATKDALKETLEAIEAMEQQPAAEAALPPLESVEQGVKLLGGTAETSRLCGTSMQAVSNWLAAGFFATDTYYILAPRFAALGYFATPRLWRMKEPPDPPVPVQSPKPASGH